MKHNTTVIRIKELMRTYQKDMTYFNYPGVLAYFSPAWHWLSFQSEKYFGNAHPFWFVFLQNGKASFRSPFFLGPAEVIVQQLKKEGLSWIAKSAKNADLAEKKALVWRKAHPIKKSLPLEVYVKLMEEAYQILLETNIYFQIASQIDDALAPEILSVFKGKSNLTKKQIFSLGVSPKKAAVVLHEELINELALWCRRHRIVLNKGGFDKAMEDKTFRKKLQSCYDSGYFLSAGYGGVKLLTLKDEYETLRKHTMTTKVKAVKPRKSLKLTDEQRKWVRIAQHLSELRDRRKSLQQQLFYYIAQVLEEISAIVGIPRSELEHLHIEQFRQNSFPKALISAIANQKKGYFSFWEPGMERKDFVGDEAIAVYEAIFKNKKSPMIQLKGQVASLGKAVGRVRIIFNPLLDNIVFKQGDILVTGMTSPDFVPLMKKAGAIVTEMGGVTSHAAIISREMQKPCIVATKVATTMLFEGDLVEVDAHKGQITVLKRFKPNSMI